MDFAYNSEYEEDRIEAIGRISSNTLAKLGRDEFISMDALARICDGLRVNIEDVVEFVED